MSSSQPHKHPAQVEIGRITRVFDIGFLQWDWLSPVKLKSGTRVRVIGGKGYGGRTFCSELREKGIAADWRVPRDHGLASFNPKAVVLVGRIAEIELARGLLHCAGVLGKDVETLAMQICELEIGQFLALRGFNTRTLLVAKLTPKPLPIASGQTTEAHGT
jgi:hypothetical protein